MLGKSATVKCQSTIIAVKEVKNKQIEKKAERVNQGLITRSNVLLAKKQG